MNRYVAGALIQIKLVCNEGTLGSLLALTLTAQFCGSAWTFHQKEPRGSTGAINVELSLLVHHCGIYPGMCTKQCECAEHW